MTKQTTSKGGPANQSGIYFQNTYAVLYLAKLLNPVATDSNKVVSVRVEAPQEVDDIVVIFSNGQRLFIQAKLGLNPSGETWAKLWNDSVTQYKDVSFNPEDRICIALADAPNWAKNLYEACKKAQANQAYIKWQECLAKSEIKILEKVRSALPHKLTDQEFLEFIKINEVDRVIQEQLEERILPYLPDAEPSKEELLMKLRDLCGGYSRYRRRFLAPDLQRELTNKCKISLQIGGIGDLLIYRKALVEKYNLLSIPGLPIGGPRRERYIWPHLTKTSFRDLTQQKELYEEEDKAKVHVSDHVDLRSFPTDKLKKAIIIAGAGHGKTTLLESLTHYFAEGPWVPVVIPLSRLLDSGLTVLSYLINQINKYFSLNIDWALLSERNETIICYDGLDELSISDRQTAKELIENHSSRYKNVPWLLTVRDSKALPGAFGADILELNPFDENQQEEFLLAWAPEIINRLGHIWSIRWDYPDLERLFQIPLYLALVAASSTTENPLPKNRKELFEKYLHLLLNPEEHKPTQGMSCDPYYLRELLQELSFESLESSRFSVQERRIAQWLRKKNIQMDSRKVAGDVSKSGLFRIEGGNLVPTFPIMMEYLAAGNLNNFSIDELVVHYRKSEGRPWAQMLLFCLEQYQKVDELVEALLQEPDDAFDSGLMRIGYAVANGAAVGDLYKSKIGQKLATRWSEATWKQKKNIGRILADGFYLNPPQEALDFAIRWTGAYRSADLIARSERTDFILPMMLGEIQRDYQDWSDFNECKHKYPTIISSVISKLIENETLEDKDYKLGELLEWAGSNDSVLLEEWSARYQEYPYFSCVAAMLLEYPVKGEILDKIKNTYIRKIDEEKSYHFKRLLQTAVHNSKDKMRYLLSLFNDPFIPIEFTEGVISRTDLGYWQPNRLETINWFWKQRKGLRKHIQYSLRIWKAMYGDDEQQKWIVDHLEKLVQDQPYRTLHTFQKFNSPKLFLEGLEKLKQMNIADDLRPSMASVLTSICIHSINLNDYFGDSWACYPCPRHEHADFVAELIEDWLSKSQIGSFQYLQLLNDAYKLSPYRHAQALYDFLSNQINITDNWDWDQEISEGISNLQENQKVTQKLTCDQLVFFIKTFDGNVSLRAVSALQALATEKALSALIELIEEKPSEDSILEAIEELSFRLNKRVIQKNGKLKVL